MGIKLPSKSTLSKIADKITPAPAKPALQKAQAKVTTEVKAHPNAAVAALAVVDPVGAVGLVAVEHKDEIKSTLAPVAEAVKKDSVVAEKDTIQVAKEAGTDVKSVAKSATSGFENMYIYGMVAVGAIILLKIL